MYFDEHIKVKDFLGSYLWFMENITYGLLVVATLIKVNGLYLDRFQNIV